MSEENGGYLPLPVACGGVGLILAYAVPGGLTGGRGFLVGLAVGLVLTAIRVIVSFRSAESELRAIHCPSCDANLVVKLAVSAEAKRDVAGNVEDSYVR